MNPNELDKFLEQSPLLKKEVIVLAQTENSELVEVLKPCNKEFFEQVFSPTGPYWTTYFKLGFGEIPNDAKYLAIVNERMYFCKNTEKIFLYSVGPKKSFSYKNSELKESIAISFGNFLRLISSPFDFSKQVATIALASIRINEEMEKFEKFSKITKDFWKNNSSGKTASLALEGAVQAMGYSFYASLAYSLKVKLRDSTAWQDCELENLSKKALEKNSFELFGFYSKNPYDISIPRFSEKSEQIKEFANFKFPLNPAARWRENCKFLCARHLAVLRKIFLETGEKNELGEKVFFLKPNELSLPQSELERIVNIRKKSFETRVFEKLPQQIVFDGKWNTEIIVNKKNELSEIKGISAGGQSTAVGEIVFVDSEKDFEKDLKGKIVVSKTLSPNLVRLFDRIRGIVSAGGGRVAHTAIVSLEQGMVCVVQAKNLELIKEGDQIRVNGASGKIEKLP